MEIKGFNLVEWNVFGLKLGGNIFLATFFFIVIIIIHNPLLKFRYVLLPFFLGGREGIYTFMYLTDAANCY